MPTRPQRNDYFLPSVAGVGDGQTLEFSSSHEGYVSNKLLLLREQRLFFFVSIRITTTTM